jgi:hypothetical protein
MDSMLLTHIGKTFICLCACALADVFDDGCMHANHTNIHEKVDSHFST